MRPSSSWRRHSTWRAGLPGRRRSVATNYIYNRIAGNNLGRVTALSDGVFAFGMTLLVLDLHVPTWPAMGIPTESSLLGALHALAPKFGAYLMSFITLGIFWVGQQTQLNSFDRLDRNLAWIHIMFLLGVATLPFSTGLLAEYMMLRTAVAIYWFNIFYLGLILFVSWQYVNAQGLWKSDVSPEVRRAQRYRIVTAQLLYLGGALLCIWNTYVSVVAIFVLQAYYAIAPRIFRRREG